MIDTNLFNPHVIQCSYLTRQKCPPPGTIYEQRRVKWYELELIEWGEGFIITEGQKIPAKKGCIFFRKPGMVVQGISPYCCKMIIFDGQYRQQYLSYDDQNKLSWDDDFIHCSTDIDSIPAFANIPPVYSISQYTEFEILFSKIYDSYISSKVISPILVKTYLLQILLLLSEELEASNYFGKVSRSVMSNYNRIMKVKLLIDSDSGWNMKLDELAENAGISTNFFCKIFKEIIGQSPITYINTQRMAKARKLLIETDFSAKHIALDCGFDNETYFFTLFRKSNGMSPLEYRALHGLNFTVFHP